MEMTTKLLFETSPAKKPAFLDKTSITIVEDIRTMVLITRCVALPLTKIKVKARTTIGKDSEKTPWAIDRLLPEIALPKPNMNEEKSTQVI